MGQTRSALAKAAAPAPLTPAADGIDVAALHHHGRLTRAEAARAERVALLEVIAPCARALTRGDGIERPSFALPAAV